MPEQRKAPPLSSGWVNEQNIFRTISEVLNTTIRRYISNHSESRAEPYKCPFHFVKHVTLGWARVSEIIRKFTTNITLLISSIVFTYLILKGIHVGIHENY